MIQKFTVVNFLHDFLTIIDVQMICPGISFYASTEIACSYFLIAFQNCNLQIIACV